MGIARLLLIIGMVLPVQLVAGAQVPAVLHAEPAALAGQGGQMEWIAFDGEGTLWALDRSSAKLVAFDGSLKPVRSFGKAGSGSDRLQQPVCFSIEGGRAAVADEGYFKIFSLKNGEPLNALSPQSPEGAYTQPYAGFQLLPGALLLTGQTFTDSKHMAEGGAAKVSTLASISLKDKRWAFLRSEEVRAAERPAFFLFGRGLGAYWPDQRAWAVTQKLPRQVVLVDQDARVLRVSEAVPAKWPVLGPLDSPQQQMMAWVQEKYVVALLPAGKRLAIIWHIPAGASPRYEIEWMGKDLRPLGTTRLDFPVKFAPDDIFYSATADAKGRAFILILKRPMGGSSSSALFSVDLGRP